MPHVHLNREIDLHEIIRRFARLHLRDLRNWENGTDQYPDIRKGYLGPELKSIKIPGEQEFLVIVAPHPTQTHTQFPMKNIAQSQGGTAIYRLYRYEPL